MKNYYLRFKDGTLVHYYGDLDDLLRKVVKNTKINKNILGSYGIKQLEKFNRAFIIDEFTSMQIIGKEEYNRECLKIIKQQMGFQLKN